MPTAITTNCYLLLEDGGHLILEDGTGFLELEVCDIVNQASNWKLHADEHDRKTMEARNREYAERLASKEVEVISLKIEAQDLRIQEKELAALKDKQSKRHLKAIEKEKLALAIEIEKLMLEVLEMRRINFENQNNVALLVLSMSLPFFNLSGGIRMN